MPLLLTDILIARHYNPILPLSQIMNLRIVCKLFRWHEMEKRGCLRGSALPDRKFIYHACLPLLHWQDLLLIRSQTEHSKWICNCPLRDAVRAPLCSLIIIQSKLVVDRVIIMTISCGSIPYTPQESYSVMLAARAESQPHGLRRTTGRAKVFTGSINRMEVPLHRERNPGPQETGQITGLSSAPRTCFDCNVLCFLLVFPPPPRNATPPSRPQLLPWIPPVPIKLNCTETMLSCGGVGS